MEQIKNIAKKHFSVEDPTTPNYGYVPFKYFQLVVIVLIALSFIFKDKINEKLNKHVYIKLNKYVKNRNLFTIIRALIAIFPTIIILHYDIKYRSFSLRNMGVTKIISDKFFNEVLRFLGAYVIIQVAAQDFGVKTGDIQSDTTKLPILQYFLYAGAAYAISQDRSLALIASLMYFQLKYFASDKIKDVCFD
jgi:hypothetical protein